MKNCHKESEYPEEGVVTSINREVIVSISLDGEDIRVGTLWFNLRSGRERASFEYDKSG